MAATKDIHRRLTAPSGSLPWLAALLVLCGCSPSRLAEEAVANSIAGTSGTFASDDDPLLIEAAVPFALKTMESLLVDLPRHERLLRAAASGFAGFGYAFVQEDADEFAVKEPDRAAALRLRARKLFLRARGYGLRGLEVAHPGLADALLTGNAEARRTALAATVPEDVPTLYWTGVPWALAIADGKDQLVLVGQLPALGDLMDRALTLDPDWNAGSLHEFFVSFDSARDHKADAEAHYKKALELDHGTRLGVKVAYAESVLVASQDRAAFEKLLREVLLFAVDAKAARPDRLANLLAQRRARWLLSRADDLFV